MAQAFPKSIWVVVPAYNEAPYIKRVLEKIRQQTQNIIVVDDGSIDQTTESAQHLARYVLRHRLNMGKGAALKTGCEFAFSHLQASAIIMLDADDQHDPAELPLFVSQLQAGHSLVLGVRNFGSQMPLSRKAGNQFASTLIQWLFGVYVPDIPSGFKGFSSAMYRELAWQVSDYAVELEISMQIAQKKLPFSTVPIKTIYHDHDKGMTMLDTLAMLKQIIAFKFRL